MIQINKKKKTNKNKKQAIEGLEQPDISTNEVNKVNQRESHQIEMKQIEKEIKGKEYTKEYKLNNYNNLLIETEKLRRMKEEKKKKKEEIKRKEHEKKQHEEASIRNKSFDKYLTENEMILLEKEIGRYVDWKIFNSDVQSWSKNDSYFSRKIYNKSKIIIVIETTEGKKFGCYIDSQITERKKYISDPNAFPSVVSITIIIFDL